MKQNKESKKLIYVANARIPTEKAHGIQIVKMCEAFAQQGNEVLLLVPKRVQTNPNLVGKDVFEYHSVKKNFSIEFAPNIDLLFLEQRGVKLGNFLYLLQEASFTLVATALTWNRPGLVYTRSKPYALVKGILDQPVVYESHARAGKGWIDHKIAENTKAVVAITKSIQRSWKELSAKTIFAPDGVSGEFFQIFSKTNVRKKLKLPINKTIVGYVGNLVTLNKEKGIKELILAIKRLSKGRKEIICCIVGGPERWRRVYEAFARRHHFREKIIFTGHVPFKKTPEYLQAMDVLVIPFPNEPHFAYNASPLKLFEYMAAGKPIVASDLPSIRDILDKDSAVLAKAGNPTALAQGIKKVLENPEFAKRLARNANSESQKYTWTRRAESILKSM